VQELEVLDIKLPVDGAQASGQKEPWLLHSMDVNALNFCAFAMCFSDRSRTTTTSLPVRDEEKFSPILIAAPNALDSGGIDIFHLPTERRMTKISSDKTTTTGMVMALNMFLHPTKGQLMVISGYEGGQTIVHTRTHESSGPWLWKKVLLSKPHNQPLLSIDASPLADTYYTSSADAVIAKFAIPLLSNDESLNEKPSKVLNTKHAGQQGLTVRSDGKILATAGWDARVRVYSAKTMKELAVLKWHKEGCYTVAFAQVVDKEVDQNSRADESAVAQKTNAVDVIRAEREAKAQRTHWLAAGGKDAKVSLWEVY
jgi:WD40 repeat protein